MYREEEVHGEVVGLDRGTPVADTSAYQGEPHSDVEQVPTSHTTTSNYKGAYYPSGEFLLFCL